MSKPMHVWGDGVRAVRGVHGFTVQQLAFLAHTDEATIARLEAGDRDVSVEVRQGIADALQVDADRLFWEDGAQVIAFPIDRV